MTLASAGIALGLLGAMATNHPLVAMLFDVSPSVGLTLSAVALALLGVAALASLVPTRLSARVEPAAALRAE